MIKTTLLNGITTERDKDYTALGLSILDAGVVSGLAVTENQVGLWVCFVKVTRTATTPTEEVLVKLEITANETIDTSGTKKVWIEIDQNNINDPGLNDANGTTAGSIETGADYPAGNYIPLASIVSGVITDERTFIRHKKNIELRGDLLPKGIKIVVDEDYTFTGLEQNNAILEVDTTAGDITIDLDLSLFPINKGFYTFKFFKKTSDANKIIIDTWTGVIDNANTYEISNYLETVTIEILSSAFAKALSNTNLPISSPVVQNLTKEWLIAGEAMSALQVYRRWLNTDLYLSQLDESSSQVFLSTNLEVWQSINFKGWVTSVKTKLKRNNSGLAQNISVKIYSDASFSTLIWTSNNSVLATSIPTTFTEYTFNFSNLYVWLSWTIYIKLDTDGAWWTTTNNVSVATSTISVIDWTMYTFNSTWWSPTAIGKDMYFEINGIYETNNKFYLAKANNIDTKNFEWIVWNNVILDWTFKWTFTWIVWWFTNLLTWHNVWDLIYIQDNWSIWFTAWTISVVIWKIYSNTEIELTNRTNWETSTTATTWGVTLWNAQWYITINIPWIWNKKIPYYGT